MSETYCEVDFRDASDDADSVELYDARVIAKGRKVHTCNECQGVIAVGESYLRKSYRFEGEFCVECICIACREVADEFDHRLAGGMLWESFWGEWDQGANLQGCLNRLTGAKAKAVMHTQWLKWRDTRAEQERAYRDRMKARSAPPLRMEPSQ